jgi:RNA polymerase sigma-70 factor (ECF subfamily)
MPKERSSGANVTARDREKSESRRRALTVVSGMPEASDQDLVLLLRQRDARGFDLAYARYAQRIFGFLLRLTRLRATAEDLFQHTFLRLAERGPGLHPDSDLRAWLFTVARNAFHSHARALASVAHAQHSLLPSGADTVPESGLLLGELELALASLATDDRELLLLVGVEGLSQAEVSSMLGVDAVTLRKRLSRARARLADVLDEADAIMPKSETDR